jgi:hypothetical protein
MALWDLLLALGGHVPVILGSFGLIFFVTKFGFATNLNDNRSGSRWWGLRGDQVWRLSWGLIVVGTVVQLVDRLKLVDRLL